MDQKNIDKINGSGGLIDITGILEDLIKGVIALKWRFLLVLIICTALFTGYKRMTYHPYYEAASTYTITSSISADATNTYLDNTTASQMAKSFPYILDSGVLKTVVAEDLGVDSIPGEVKASVMADTNLFTITVTSSDPNMASKILASVVKNYPEVAEFVIGSSSLTLVDETGVPSAPANPFGYRHEIMIGLMIGIIVCFLLDLLAVFGRNTVKSEKDFKRFFSIKGLGTLPRAKFHKRRKEVKELILIDNPKMPRDFIEASKMIRRRIERANQEKGTKSFLVTSAMPGEGKSTVSANVALALGLKDYKVILVDADLRNPSTAKIFGMEQMKIGTLEVIRGEKKIDEAVQQYKDSNVSILAGSNPIQDTSGVLSGENMRKFIRDLEAEYDVVIIDTPPSAMLADAAIVAQYVDGAVFVVRQDYTEVDRILEGMEILSASGVTIHGCILNDENTLLKETTNYHEHMRKPEAV